MLPYDQMVVYFAVWYLFMITTYGVWVPAGLFLPGIIIGCAVGSIYIDVVREILGSPDPNDNHYQEVIPIVLASGAMLSSYTRLTYSLLVVMLETTQADNIFVPMLITLMVSRSVAN